MATTYDWWMPLGTDGKAIYCSAVQDFVASTTYKLEEIRLKLAKYADQQPTTGTIYLYLADENHDPIGTALLTIGSITDADLTTTYTWKTFAGLDYTIVKDTRYAIVMVISGDAVCVSDEVSDNCVIKWQGKDGYADGLGQHKQCALNGEWACSLTWTSAIFDFSFRSMGQELPGKPTNPSPSHEASDITLDESPLSWDASDPAADTYEIYFREQGEDWDLIGTAQVGVSYALDFGYINYEKTYEWRVDATNVAGTTTGDTWSFDSIVFDTILSGASGGSGGGGGGGGTGEESSPNGENNMITLRRLVAAANSKIWYEDI